MDPAMTEKFQYVEDDSGGSSLGFLSEKGAACEADLNALLADAGYVVKASQLGHVAQRLEQLESILGAAQDAGITHLSSEAIHYNPSDLAGWIECMIEELAPNPTEIPRKVAPEPVFATSSLLRDDGGATTQQISPLEMLAGMSFDEDLGELQSNNNVFYPAPISNQSSMDMARIFHYQEPLQQAPIARFPSVGLYAQQPILYAEADEVAQESGIRLVHLLLACGEAVQRNNLSAADEMVGEIRKLAFPQGGAMGKVAGYFVDALARRIYAGMDMQDNPNFQADSLSELLYFHFYETCPYLKFAHFTANQAILEAFEGHKQVHVIDFNLMQGLQWPALIQALALRPGGPPHLRLTGIGPPQLDGNDILQEIGMKLARLAEFVNVEFDFRGVVATKLDDVKPWMLQVREGEAVAVNSIMQLHRLLYSESSLPPINEVLQSIRSLNPRIVTVVEQEANHNSPVFFDRFMQSLHYYSTMFDSLEASNLPPPCSKQLLAEMYLGKEICNIVSCEGPLRLERHEPLSQWRMRMFNAGFRPLHLSSIAFKQASMLLTLFSGEGYTVEENNGCLTLGWHSRPLVAASAWQCR